MYRPTSGRIRVDGIDLADIDTAGWRAGSAPRSRTSAAST